VNDSEVTPMLMTTRDLARSLRMSERAIFTLRKESGLPSVRLGKSVRFRPSDVQEWLAARAAPGGAPCEP
jgi:excisionase family DNA binding protein